MNKSQGASHKEAVSHKAGRKSQLGHEPGNEGEGSRTAAKDYNERTEKFIRSGRVKPSAEEAERAVEGKGRNELEKAEEIGKRHAKH
jgi:hypothetical protein